MLETALHRQVALAVALVALASTGAVAGVAVGQTAVPPIEQTDASALGSDRLADHSPSRNATVTAGASDSGPLVLQSAPNQTVRVESDAPAGTELTVTIRSVRFNLLVTSEVTVGDDGTGNATFNLSNVEPGTTFTATVGSDAKTEVDGVVVNDSATVRRDAAFAVADPSSNYTVHGRVMDPAVSRLDVRITPAGGSSEPRTVAVREDGTFRATFDLSSVSAGTEVSVEVNGIPRSVTPVVVTDEDRAPTVYAFVETTPNATIQYPAETILVHSAPDQTVRGTTNLRPGTELTVTAVNDELNSPRAFTRSVNVTVREDGSFAATLDFDGVEPGTNFTVRVGPGLTYSKGRVVSDSVTLPTDAITTTTTPTPTTVNESGFPFTSTTDTTDGRADEFGVPGFGVPAALAALLAALALARRD